MSKRQEVRAKRRRQRMVNRITIIGLVVVGALLIALALILPGINNANQKATQMANLTAVPVVTIVPRTFPVPTDRNTIGDPTAPIKIDVWEDFQCSACLNFSKNTEPLIIQNYVNTGKVYYVFHFFPAISSYSPGNTESEHAANASLCAADQGKFWEYHDILFANWNGENQGAYVDTRLIAFAESIGLTMKDFKSCLNSDKYGSFISQDFTAGQNQGVSGTPSVFVNNGIIGKLGYVPSYQEISGVIEAILAGK